MVHRPKKTIVINKNRNTHAPVISVPNEVFEIKNYITSGVTIPNTFYRSSAGGDRLLREKGWLHLHVGRDIDDNILLIVEQIKEGVIFICLADHEIFKENPLGNSLSGLNSKIEQEKLNLKKLAATKQTSPVTPPSPPKVTNADLCLKTYNLFE